MLPCMQGTAGPEKSIEGEDRLAGQDEAGPHTLSQLGYGDEAAGVGPNSRSRPTFSQETSR